MSRRARLTFATLAANGSTTGQDWPGGDGWLIAEGTFGGGSLALQIQGPGGAWCSVTQLAATTAIAITTTGQSANFRAPAGQLRVTLTGATGPSLTASATGVPANAAG